MILLFELQNVEEENAGDQALEMLQKRKEMKKREKVTNSNAPSMNWSSVNWADWESDDAGEIDELQAFDKISCSIPAFEYEKEHVLFEWL